jgi:CheY-like chemotaxis protein
LAVSCILVVDDEAIIRTMVAEALELEGFRVRTATNGADALVAVATHRPEAMLLDLTMPVLDGWALMAGVRRLPGGAQLPLYVMSATAAAAEQLRNLDVQQLFPKPFDLDTVIASLRSHHPLLGPGRPGGD